MSITCYSCNGANPKDFRFCAFCGESFIKEPSEKRYEVTDEMVQRENYTTSLAKDIEKGGERVVLKSADISNAPSLEGLEEEFERLTKIDITGIPQVFDIYEEGESLITVGPFIFGKNLNDYLKGRKGLEGKELELFIFEFLTIIDELHKNGIVHGNIKPENIILDKKLYQDKRKHGREPFLYLTDFTALSLSSGDYPDHLLPPELTTFDMTPGRDLYAAGLILIQALTGKSVKKKDVEDFDAFINSLELGLAMRPVIERLINPDADLRYSQAGGVIDDLDKARSLWGEKIVEEGGVSARWSYYNAGFLNVTIREINAVAMSPDGRLIALSDDNGSLHLWDISSGAYLAGFKSRDGAAVRAITLSRDGNLIASGNDDGEVLLWLKSQEGEPIRVMSGHTGEINKISFTPDEKKLISVSDDRSVRVWKIDSGECIFDHREHKDIVIGVSVSPDEKTYATSSYDRTIKLWDMKKGKSIRTILSHIDTVLSLVFSTDGETILGGSKDGSVGLWKVSSGKPIKTFNDHDNLVSSIAVNTHKGFFVSSGFDNRLIIRGLKGKGPLKVINAPGGRTSKGIIYVSFSPDGQYVIFCIEDTGVFAWDISTDRVEKFLGTA